MGPTFNFTSLPPDLSVLTGLQSLSLPGQHILGGTVPQEYSTLTLLTHLSLGCTDFDNLVTGTLPDNWWTLENMKSFSLSRMNLLTGSLPDWWYAWYYMESLSLVNLNSITGTLPPDWGYFWYYTSFTLGEWGRRVEGTTPGLLWVSGGKGGAWS